jgi:uncharacterized protein (TIGR03435 family)
MLALTLLATVARGQQFEVATIKPAPGRVDGRLSMRMSVSKGRLNYTNVSLRDVVKAAYQVAEDQVAGPEWIDVERFSIAAKLPDGSASGEVPRMLQALLAERFKLALHRETREMPAYWLTVAKNGNKLKQTESAGGLSIGDDRVRHHISGRVTMESFADFLTQRLKRPVLDKTGMTGPFEVALEWVTDDPEASGPSLFTALQEQMGLKLEAHKGPREILVIDRAEKAPTEN